MTDDNRTQRLWSLFRKARALPPAEQHAWIELQCDGDPDLAADLAALLDASPPADFLEPAAPGFNGDPDFDPLLGTMLDEYRIESRIGSGGMGTVYRARETGPLEREVAIKVVRRGLDTEHVLARFHAERATLARLNHRALVPVHRAGVTPDGRPWFAMELIDGEPITDYCRELGLEQRLALFLEVCDAVQHIHQKGLVHRDLKPANILVRHEDNAVKLIDFGVSRALEPGPETRLTLEHQPLGTPEYMSPEQCDDATDIDTRSDVYALGVVLYELLTEVRPFTELTGAALTAAKRTGRPATPSRALTGAHHAGQRRAVAWRGRMKGDFDWIVLKALASERERRYQSANALAADIRRALDHRPIEARPPARTYLVARFVRRHPIAVGAGIAAALLLTTLTVALALRGDQLQRALDAAIAERERAEHISSFMIETFEAADPHQNSGVELSARELLEQGRNRLAGSDLEPTVQARLLLTMANTYRRLGAFDSSLSTARQALDTLAEPGTRHALELRAEVLASLTTLTRDRSEFDASAKFARQALELRTSLFGADSRPAANSAAALGYALLKSGDRHRSMPLLERAVSIHRRLGGGSDEIAPFDQLASLYVELGRYDEAEALYLESVSRSRRIHGKIHPETATRENNLAALYYRNGSLDQAAHHYEQALSIQRQLLDARHPNLLTVLNNLGALYNRMNAFDRALPVLEEALAGRREALGDEHLEVAVTTYHLANALQGLEHATEAGRAYAEAVRVMRTAAGADDRRVGVLLNGLARFQFERGELERARAAIYEALEINVAGWPEDHRTTAVSRLIAARIALASSRFQEAAALAEAALAVLDTNSGAETSAALAAATLALALNELGQFERAETLRDRAMAGLVDNALHQDTFDSLAAMSQNRVPP